MQETSVWGKFKDGANKTSNKEPVNGLKRVATLHPELEKTSWHTRNPATNEQDIQKETRTKPTSDKIYSLATKLNKTGTKPTENAKCVSGNGQLNDHRP